MPTRAEVMRDNNIMERETRNAPLMVIDFTKGKLSPKIMRMIDRLKSHAAKKNKPNADWTFYALRNGFTIIYKDHAGKIITRRGGSNGKPKTVQYKPALNEGKQKKITLTRIGGSTPEAGGAVPSVEKDTLHTST